MTTFQDPPPQSRRAVRASERGETAAASAPVAPAEGVPYTFEQSATLESAPQAPPTVAPHHSGRRASTRVGPPAGAETSTPLSHQSAPGHAMPVPEGETPEQAAYRLRDFSPEGRRSAGAHNQTGPASPTASFAPPARPVELDYQTQAAVPGAAHSAARQAPIDDSLNHTLSRRELREMRAAAEAAAPPLQAPVSDAGHPEAINTLLNSGPIEIPTLAPPPGQSQALAEAMAEFDLLTRSRREAEARARDAQVASLATPIVIPVPVEQPVASVPEPAVDPIHETEVASAPSPAVASVPLPAVASAPLPAVASVPYPASVPEPADETAAELASAPEAPSEAEPASEALAFDDLLTPSAPVAPTSSAPAPFGFPITASIPSAPAVDDVVAEASAPEAPALEESVVASAEEAPVLLSPVFSDAPGADEPAADLAGSVPTPVATSAPIQSVPVQSVPVQLVPVQSIPVHSAPDDDQDALRGRSPRASGHWRVQAAIEDEDLPFENTLSRTVGSNTSAITTSALVLPSVPSPDGILGNLTATGEILVTGTIDLPSSLGSTGAHPSRIDNSDFEDDPLDNQVAAPDSAPIRAIRAISTHTSTRGVIETKRPSGTRALTAVIIVASVLCVGLVGLLVYAFASGKL